MKASFGAVIGSSVLASLAVVTVAAPASAQNSNVSLSLNGAQKASGEYHDAGNLLCAKAYTSYPNQQAYVAFMSPSYGAVASSTDNAGDDKATCTNIGGRLGTYYLHVCFINSNGWYCKDGPQFSG